MSIETCRPRRIFLSYRREDEPTFALLLRKYFDDHYGEENVFMDVEGISAGAEFSPVIESEVAACDVLVALIGPKWVKLIRQKAIEEIDYVRMEIAIALKLKKLVVPVCFGGANVPKASEIHYQVRPMLGFQTPVLHAKGENRLEIQAFLDSIDRTYAERAALRKREEIKQQAEELDIIPPASGLALGYFVNFVSDAVHRICQLDEQGHEHLNLIEVTERGDTKPVFSFERDVQIRKDVRLHIVIPPRISLLDKTNLEPVLRILKQASILSANSARPFLVDAWRTDRGYQFIDFPKALTVINNWIQRRLQQARPNPDLPQWLELENEQLEKFELMLRWWLDDPKNGPEFRSRVQLIRFNGKEEDFQWLPDQWRTNNRMAVSPVSSK